MPHTGSRGSGTGGHVSIRARRRAHSCAPGSIRARRCRFVLLWPSAACKDGGAYRSYRVEPIKSRPQKPIHMKTAIFAKYLSGVLAVGLISFAGNAEAAIVSLDAPFDVGGNFEGTFLNFDGTSLTASSSRGANSVRIFNVYGNLYFNDSIYGSNYAFDQGNNAFLTFNEGDVVSATSTGFSSNFQNTQPSSLAPHYYVVGFYNNQLVTSFPGPPNNSPDNTFIANSNLAWLEVLNLGGTMRVAAAGGEHRRRWFHRGRRIRRPLIPPNLSPRDRPRWLRERRGAPDGRVRPDRAAAPPSQHGHCSDCLNERVNPAIIHNRAGHRKMPSPASF